MLIIALQVLVVMQVLLVWRPDAVPEVKMNVYGTPSGQNPKLNSFEAETVELNGPTFQFVVPYATYKLEANTMSRLMASEAASILRYKTESPTTRAALRTCSQRAERGGGGGGGGTRRGEQQQRPAAASTAASYLATGFVQASDCAHDGAFSNVCELTNVLKGHAASPLIDNLNEAKLEHLTHILGGHNVQAAAHLTMASDAAELVCYHVAPSLPPPPAPSVPGPPQC